jgi:5-methylcytosine-specific restriction enzyme subunit McrC
MRRIELREREECLIPRNSLSELEAKLIWEKYRNKIKIEGPSFKNNNHWQITPKAAVGLFPVSQELVLEIAPKVQVANLIKIITESYGFSSLEFPDGQINVGSMDAFFELLAGAFGRLSKRNASQGLYRDYIEVSKSTGFIVGRPNILNLAKDRRPDLVECDFEEQTTDNPHNQKILCALEMLTRAPVYNKEVKNIVREAHHLYSQKASLKSVQNVLKHTNSYNRLNSNYSLLHSLCDFFLENLSPEEQGNGRTSLPFQINMESLFERYLFCVLERQLPEPLGVNSQLSISVDEKSALRFQVDIDIYNQITGDTLAVLDAKYKNDETPTTSNISQVVTYAELQGCPHGFLIYPHPVDQRTIQITQRQSFHVS